MSSPIDDAMREQLDALLDGVLPEVEASALRARIDTDDLLRAEYDRRRRTVELVRALPTARAPEGFAASVIDRRGLGANAGRGTCRQNRGIAAGAPSRPAA